MRPIREAAKRIVWLCRFIFEPIPRLAEMHQALGLLPGAALVLGLIVSAIAGLLGEPLLIVLYALLILLLLTFWAAYRLRQTVERLEEPPARPHNWEAIIRAVRDWQIAAENVVSDVFVKARVRQERPELPTPTEDGAKRAALEDRQRVLQIELDIAGNALSDRIRFYWIAAENAVMYWCTRQDEELTEENWNKTYDNLRNCTNRLVERLAGT